jgi:hypothetical protein
MNLLKNLTFITFLWSSWVNADPCLTKTSVCEPKVEKTFKNLKRILSEQNLPLDHLTNQQEVYPPNTKYNGISYYIPTDNARYEKLEGYEDVYVISNEYVPEKHQMNRGFLGTSAVVRVDRSKTPFQYVYLSKEIHSSYAKKKELPFKNNVNEHLCSLNLSCFQKLEIFKKAAESSDFDQKIVSQYQSQLKKFFYDRYVTDIYHQEPEIQQKIKTVLDSIDGNSFKNTAEVNLFVLKEMKKITDQKLQGKTRDQYPDPLEYISYSSIAGNTKEYLESYSLRLKKDAILQFCAADKNENCQNVNQLKADLDFFQGRRKLISYQEYLPEK